MCISQRVDNTFYALWSCQNKEVISIHTGRYTLALEELPGLLVTTVSRRTLDGCECAKLIIALSLAADAGSSTNQLHGTPTRPNLQCEPKKAPSSCQVTVLVWMRMAAVGHI